MIFENLRLDIIRKIAYSLWEKAGKPKDKSLDFWLLAEKEYNSSSILKYSKETWRM